MANTNTRHKQQLKLSIRRTKAFLNKQGYYPRQNVMADAVILGLMSKAVKVAEGVVVLLDAGLPDEAFGLSRTLVEVALNLRFITNRYTERRARRFARYAGKWKIQMMRRLAQLTPRRRSRAEQAEVHQSTVAQDDARLRANVEMGSWLPTVNVRALVSATIR